jgi:hypothetical protein
VIPSTNSERAAAILNASADELPEVERVARQVSKEDHLLCWHFWPTNGGRDTNGVDWDERYLEPAKDYIARHFPDATADLVGGPVGIELWENICPTRTWLHGRVDEMARFADETGIRLAGWSYEPRGVSDNPIPQAFASDENEQER